MDCVFFLVHVVDDVRTCREQMVFYVINNRVKPFTVMLEDGTLIGFTLPDGNIREGGIQPSDDGVRCTLENL